MASIINASSTGSGGLISTGDASGVLQLQSNGTLAVSVNTSQQVIIGGTTPLQSSKVTNYGRYWSGSGNSTGDAEFVFSNYASTTAGASIAIRQDIGGANNDLKFLRLSSSGVYQGISLQITQADGNITTPSNSAFIAYMTATSTASTIPFNATSLNRGSNFNTSTYTFTAPVTGLYWFNLIITYDGSGTNPNINFISLYVNGGRARDFFEGNPAWTTNTEWHSSITYYLNAGDTAFAYNGGAGNIQGGNNPNYYSLFSGYLIG
jgi:hypothetical protein